MPLPLPPRIDTERPVFRLVSGFVVLIFGLVLILGIAQSVYAVQEGRRCSARGGIFVATPYNFPTCIEIPGKTRS